MKIIISVILLNAACILTIGTSSFADEPVCHKCEKIREYNAAHPENNYFWYDDYVKDKKEVVKPTQENKDIPSTEK
jgi:hypothetical protein